MKKKMYNVPSLYVCHMTIHSCTIQNNINPPYWGSPSPVAVMELVLVQIVVAMSNCHQPLISLEGLELANSLIKGIEVQERLKKFEATRKHIPTRQLGKRHWSSFLHRNVDILTTKYGQKYTSICGEWSKISWVSQMYDKIC